MVAWLFITGSATHNTNNYFFLIYAALYIKKWKLRQIKCYQNTQNNNEIFFVTS